MHKVLSEIREIINKCIREYLPDVPSGDLEENGKIFYMNGNNGTEFDWYVNEHISNFMVFYNDEKNLGAVKLTLYTDGKTSIYIYGEKGNTLVKEIETAINITEQEMLALAVLLEKTADSKRIFDKNIDQIDSDLNVSAAGIRKPHYIKIFLWKSSNGLWSAAQMSMLQTPMEPLFLSMQVRGIMRYANF